MYGYISYSIKSIVSTETNLTITDIRCYYVYLRQNQNGLEFTQNKIGSNLINRRVETKTTVSVETDKKMASAVPQTNKCQVTMKEFPPFLYEMNEKFFSVCLLLKLEFVFLIMSFTQEQ